MKEKKIPSVLIVDDDSMSRDLIARGLEKYGYVIATTDTGKKAIELFDVQRFDVVLLDVNMPDVSGVGVLAEIQSRDGMRSTKIMMMSAENNAELIKQCMEYGAVDFLLKPLTLSGVVKRIDKQLDSKFAPAYKQATNQPIKSAKILIVDDQELNRDVLARRVKKLGYTTVLADSAAAATKILKQDSIDLILLDIMMPEVDGIEFLETLKGVPQFKFIPVIMLTAQSDKDSVARCIQLGADAYLLKPFDPKQLQLRIEQSMNKD